MSLQYKVEVTELFCVRIGDEVPNWSPLSNIKRVKTPDGVGPGPVINLEELP